jgi:hypothetical protein
MVNVASTAQTLSNDYAGLGDWIGLATVDGGNPSGPPAEVPTGASGYARAQTTWSPSGGGVNVGTAVTISAPPGEYTFAILCTQSDPNQPGDKVIDYCKISGAILNNDGQIVVTPTYTQT